MGEFVYSTLSRLEGTQRDMLIISIFRHGMFSAAFNWLITELGSIRYVPGSNYQLQLLAPLRSFGDKHNKTTNKTIDCHL